LPLLALLALLGRGMRAVIPWQDVTAAKQVLLRVTNQQQKRVALHL